jgi:type II secretory pathway pseudopilin PulG
MRLLIKALVKSFSKSKQLEGFSLVELVVSLFIIAMISGLFLANYRSAGRRSELINVIQTAVVDIRACQGYSVGSKFYGDSLPGGGWGVYFSTAAGANNKYIIFADIDGEKDYDDANEAIEANGARIVLLPANIEISAINYNGSLTSAAVVFLPPDPQTYINGTQTGSVAIIFREKTNFSTSTIEINPFGLVDASR